MGTWPRVGKGRSQQGNVEMRCAGSGGHLEEILAPSWDLAKERTKVILGPGLHIWGDGRGNVPEGRLVEEDKVTPGERAWVIC